MSSDQSQTRQRSSYVGRLVTDQDGNMSLFIPFFVFNNQDTTRDDTLVLVNFLNQTYTILPDVPNIEALFGVSDSTKAGLPPASKASIEALKEVEIGDDEQKDCVSECAICLDGMKVAKVMPCEHSFHGGCLEKWLKIHGSCPVCRFQMPLEDEKSTNCKDEGNGGVGTRGVAAGDDLN